jgi:hypothetical protein
MEGRQYTKNNKMKEMVWGGYYGGRAEAVTTVRGIFENLVCISLEGGEMWTEETLYSIMIQRYPYIINHVHEVNMNALQEPIYDRYRHKPIEELREIHLNFSLPTCSEYLPIPPTIVIPVQSSAHLHSFYKVYLGWLTIKQYR